MVFGTLPTDSADLSIKMNVVASGTCANSLESYKVIIKNLGPDTAKAITATTKLAANINQQAFTITKGSYNQSSGFWSIPFIKSGDSALLSISGTVDSNMSGKTIVSYANIIQSGAIDTNLNNNNTSISLLVSITPTPADPLVTSNKACSGKINLKAKAGLNDTLNWYANITDISPLDTGETFITPTLTLTTTYYVQAENKCPSPRIPVTVTILSDQVIKP